MVAFNHFYSQPKSLLKSTLNQLVKDHELSTAAYKEMLELFGVIPSTIASPEK